MKCDFCGKDSKKIKTRRNFPHGKKSKGIITKMCSSCNTQTKDKKS